MFSSTFRGFSVYVFAICALKRGFPSDQTIEPAAIAAKNNDYKERVFHLLRFFQRDLTTFRYFMFKSIGRNANAFFRPSTGAGWMDGLVVEWLGEVLQWQVGKWLSGPMLAWLPRRVGGCLAGCQGGWESEWMKGWV